MKKLLYAVVVCCLIVPLAACQTKPKETNDKPSALSVQPKETDVKQLVLPAQIMLNGQIYQDTGYVNSAVTCGTADGIISASVDRSETPTQNNQSNFGEGYEFQLWDEHWVNVKINDQWILFHNIAISNRSMPEWVANFRAEVKEVSSDRVLMKLIDIPEHFEWIFDDTKIDLIKPISVPMESIDRGELLSETELHDMIGKRMRVWFDGHAEHTPSESSMPIELGEVYLIETVE